MKPGANGGEAEPSRRHFWYRSVGGIGGRKRYRYKQKQLNL